MFSNRIVLKILIFSIFISSNELKSMQVLAVKVAEKVLPSLLRGLSVGAAAYLSDKTQEIEEEEETVENLRIKIKKKERTKKEKVVDFFVEKAAQVASQENKTNLTSSFSQNQTINYQEVLNRLKIDNSAYKVDKTTSDTISNECMKQYMFKLESEKEVNLNKIRSVASYAEAAYAIVKDVSQSVKIAREIVQIEELEDKCILEQCQKSEAFKKAHQEVLNYSLDLLSETTDVTRGKFRYPALLKLNTLNIKGEYGRELTKLLNVINGYYFNKDGTRNNNVISHEKEIQGYLFDFLKSVSPNREVYLYYLKNFEKKGYKSASTILKKELTKSSFKAKDKTAKVSKKVFENYSKPISNLTQSIFEFFGSEWKQVSAEDILKYEDNKNLLFVLDTLANPEKVTQKKVDLSREILKKQFQSKTVNGQQTAGDIHNLVGMFEYAHGIDNSKTVNLTVQACTVAPTKVEEPKVDVTTTQTKDMSDTSTCPAEQSNIDLPTCGSSQSTDKIEIKPCHLPEPSSASIRTDCGLSAQTIPAINEPVVSADTQTQPNPTGPQPSPAPVMPTQETGQKEESLPDIYITDEEYAAIKNKQKEKVQEQVDEESYVSDEEVSAEKTVEKEDSKISGMQLHNAHVEQMNGKLKGKEKELEAVYDKNISPEKNNKIKKAACLRHDDPDKLIEHLECIKKTRENNSSKVLYDKDGNPIKFRCQEHLSLFHSDYKKGSGKPTRLAGGHLDHNGVLEELGKKDKNRVQVKIVGAKHGDFYQAEYEWCGVKSDIKDMYPKSWDDAKCEEKAMEAIQNIQKVNDSKQTRTYQGVTKAGEIIKIIVSKGNGHVLTHYPMVKEMLNNSTGDNK